MKNEKSDHEIWTGKDRDTQIEKDEETQIGRDEMEMNSNLMTSGYNLHSCR